MTGLSTPIPKVRPLIRASYKYTGEPVHFSIDPIEGQPIPRFKCHRCKRTLPQEQFGPISDMSVVGSRAVRSGRVRALHPHCFTCRSQEHKEHVGHPLYSPAIDRFFSGLVSSTKQGAKARGILFAVSKDNLLGMYLEQCGMCALSGLPMDWETRGQRGPGSKNFKRPSVDRINNNGNYVMGNVHIVMSIVNIMKQDLPADMFVALCRKIGDHNFSLG